MQLGTPKRVQVFILQDLFLDCNCYGDSFETSVPWDKCEQLCINTKASTIQELTSLNIFTVTVTCRVTQIYDAGACVYFYVAFRDTKIMNPMEVFQKVEHVARETILSSGETPIDSSGNFLFENLPPIQVEQYRTTTELERSGSSGTSRASPT